MSDDVPHVPPTDWSGDAPLTEERAGLLLGAQLAALVNDYLHGLARRPQLELALKRYDRWAVDAGRLDPELALRGR